MTGTQIAARMLVTITAAISDEAQEIGWMELTADGSTKKLDPTVFQLCRTAFNAGWLGGLERVQSNISHMIDEMVEEGSSDG